MLGQTRVVQNCFARPGTAKDLPLSVDVARLSGLKYAGGVAAGDGGSAPALSDCQGRSDPKPPCRQTHPPEQGTGAYRCPFANGHLCAISLFFAITPDRFGPTFRPQGKSEARDQYSAATGSLDQTCGKADGFSLKSSRVFIQFPKPRLKPAAKRRNARHIPLTATAPQETTEQ